METITKKNTIKEKLITEFESSKNLLFGNLLFREQAMESFAVQGIPNRKNEEYKYVNMELMLKGDFALSDQQTLTNNQIEHFKFLKNAFVVVLVNGIFKEELSQLKNLPKG